MPKPPAAARRPLTVHRGLRAVAVMLAGALVLPLPASAGTAVPAAPRSPAASAPKAAKPPRAAASAPRKAAPATRPAVPPPVGAAAPAEPAAAAAVAPAGAAPSYRTRIPPAAKLNYRLSRGALVGSAELDWRPEAGAYTLRLEGKLPLIGTLIVQTSRGGFDAAGLAPRRYTDRRLRRSEQTASFQRDAGRVGFSGGQPEQPLAVGMQDRLSVMLQLAAIAGAWAEPPAAGTLLNIPVVGARGDADVWALRYEGRQSVDTPAGPVAALRFLREPEGSHDTRAEFWLDPARAHLPVRARLTDGRSDALELLRE